MEFNTEQRRNTISPFRKTSSWWTTQCMANQWNPWDVEWAVNSSAKIITQVGSSTDLSIYKIILWKYSPGSENETDNHPRHAPLCRLCHLTAEQTPYVQVSYQRMNFKSQSSHQTKRLVSTIYTRNSLSISCNDLRIIGKEKITNLFHNNEKLKITCIK